MKRTSPLRNGGKVREPLKRRESFGALSATRNAKPGPKTPIAKSRRQPLFAAFGRLSAREPTSDIVVKILKIITWLAQALLRKKQCNSLLETSKLITPPVKANMQRRHCSCHNFVQPTKYCALSPTSYLYNSLVEAAELIAIWRRHHDT